MSTVDAALSDALSRLLERTVDRGRMIRHGLAAVGADDGSWLWQHAHGVTDPHGTQATVDTRYIVASVTKLYTACVAMRLIEDGQLGLDDRLVDCLPTSVTDGLHVLRGADHTGALRVEHLLSHTSGLPDYYEEAPRGAKSPQARLLAGEDVPVPFDAVLRIVRDDLMPHFPPQPRNATKRRAKYTDTNFQLLGAVIESATGKPLRDVFDELLFTPLALTSTSSYPNQPRSGETGEPEASVWSGDVVLQPQGALTHQVADGGVISTLADQVRFLSAVVSGDVFAQPATWARMQHPTNRIFFPVEYGLGVMRYAPPRWMSPFFAIPPMVGHSGSTASWLFHVPDLGVVVAGTFDVARPPLPFRFVPQLLRVVAQHLR